MVAPNVVHADVAVSAVRPSAVPVPQLRGNVPNSFAQQTIKVRLRTIFDHTWRLFLFVLPPMLGL